MLKVFLCDRASVVNYCNLIGQPDRGTRKAALTRACERMHLPGKIQVWEFKYVIFCTVFPSICSGALGVLGANIYSERPQFYINRTVSIFSGADLDNWILDFDFDFLFILIFLSLSQPLHPRQLIVAKQMDLKLSLGSNFIQSNQILLKKKRLHRMFVQLTSVAMTVKQKHIRAKPLRAKYIRRLAMHEGFLL